MFREVFWTAEARADLIEITRRIAADNPTAAERVAARIFNTSVLLGTGLPGRNGRVDGTFEKLVSRLPYILAYEVSAGPAGASQIVILHVIHGARQWPKDAWPATGLK